MVRVHLPQLKFELTVPWPSGEGSCLTNRRSAVRVRPGLLGLSAECAGFARDLAKVEDQVRLLTWALTTFFQQRNLLEQQMTEKRFSIRLANGNTQTFDSASQLASWTQSQHAFSKTPTAGRRRKHDHRRRRVQNPTQVGDGRLPLAKYNRRQNLLQQE